MVRYPWWNLAQSIAKEKSANTCRRSPGHLCVIAAVAEARDADVISAVASGLEGQGRSGAVADDDVQAALQAAADHFRLDARFQLAAVAWRVTAYRSTAVLESRKPETDVALMGEVLKMVGKVAVARAILKLFKRQRVPTTSSAHRGEGEAHESTWGW
jgi:hypothetical protein